jgi:segregation and condensation protein B
LVEVFLFLYELRTVYTYSFEITGNFIQLIIVQVNNTQLIIEALIFASEQSIRLEEIQYCLQRLLNHDCTDVEVIAHLTNIKEKYASDGFAIELVHTSGGYQFLTKKAYHTAINQLLLQRSNKKLSQSALETLAIIAYKQPVTKLDIEQIRGVNSDYTIQRLLDKELITIKGRSETVGKPILYGTSQLFMDHFGINNMTELPRINEFNADNDGIGNKSE